MIRENGGWDDFEMIEIEKYPCNDSNESSARERYWKEHFNANMNTQIPGIYNELGKQGYHKQSHILEQKNKIYKKYYIDNKDAIMKDQKQKFNCACKGKYTYAHRAGHLKTSKHLNYLDNLINNHAEIMEKTDNFLDDINNFINNLK
jgi:hypothetical protein